MNLEKIMQEVKEKEISSREEYDQLEFKLRQLEETSNKILDYLSLPQRTNSEKQILITNEQINSEYLKNLAETLEHVEEKFWDYRNENPCEDYPVELVYNKWDEKYNALLMYSSYLKSRKNPQVLNKDELKRIKKHFLNPQKFQLDMSEEKYDKINQKLENIEYKLIPEAIVFSFKLFYGILKTIGKGLKFIDKSLDARVTEDGTIPEELFNKK